MGRMIDEYREGKSTLREIDRLGIRGKNANKATFFSVLIVLALAAPIAILIVTLYFQYSPVMSFYWILCVISGLLLMLFNSFSTILYILLLQNYYPELTNIQGVRLRSIFIKELFNPLNLIVIAIFIFLLIQF